MIYLVTSLQRGKKVEECIPSEDTDSDNNYKPFINYEDANWSKDDYEWLKNEDGTNIKEVKDEKTRY